MIYKYDAYTFCKDAFEALAQLHACKRFNSSVGIFKITYYSPVINETFSGWVIMGRYVEEQIDDMLNNSESDQTIIDENLKTGIPKNRLHQYIMGIITNLYDDWPQIENDIQTHGKVISDYQYSCDGCDENIIGDRYHHTKCTSYNSLAMDLCSKCYNGENKKYGCPWCSCDANNMNAFHFGKDFVKIAPDFKEAMNIQSHFEDYYDVGESEKDIKQFIYDTDYKNLNEDIIKLTVFLNDITNEYLKTEILSLKHDFTYQQIYGCIHTK